MDETHLREACQCGLIIKDVQSTTNNNNINNGIKQVGQKITNKIFGGQIAEVNSIPWQIGIKVMGQFPFCGKF